MEHEGKSEIRMTQTYSYEHRVLIVWSIEALEFRIFSVLRALYFEFDIQPPLCRLSSVLRILFFEISNLPAACCPLPADPYHFSYLTNSARAFLFLRGG
jgi:hypothetical protein